MVWFGFKYCLDLFSTTGVWVRQTDVLSILGLTVRPLIQNTNDTTLKKLKFGHSTDFYGFPSIIKTVFVFCSCEKLTCFSFFVLRGATWRAHFYEWALVVRDQPKRERAERGREREREKWKTTNYNSHREKTHEQKILECRKKILTKILCGCTNPITSMAPTDHCRTQPTEHRLGRNSNDR